MNNKPIVEARSRTYEEWERALVPCRFYLPGLVLGSHDMFGLTICTDPDFPRLMDRLQDSGEIEHDAVASLLRTHCINFTEQHRDIIYIHLNLMRVTCPESERLDSNITDQYRDVTKALNTLQVNLLGLIADADHALRAASQPQAFDDPGARDRRMNHRRERQASLIRLYCQVRATAPALPMIGAGKRASTWHDDARMLRVILRGMASETGGDAGFKSPTTPSVEFIHHALDLAGIEHGDEFNGPGAIAKMFQRDDQRLGITATR